VGLRNQIANCSRHKKEGILMPRLKTEIRILSRIEMATAEQSNFNKAIDSLLVELVRDVDRQNKGTLDGTAKEQMGRIESAPRRSAER
jgi:hypothetical protein